MTKARILIVEDEGIVRMDIQQRLLALGYEVVDSASTGEAAIDKAGALQPDLVLMDIKLKGEMDGIQAASIIRKRYHLPVIFLTAFADEETLQRAQVTDAFGYILKPFEERELSINIEMALYKHHTEQQLRDSELRMRTIFNSAMDGMFLINLEHKTLEINPAGFQMFGYTAEDLMNGDINQLLFPEDIKRAAEESGIWRSGGGPIERRHRRKDGKEIWVEMQVAPLILNGEAHALATMRDITERKQDHLALKESEERYMLAALAANDGLWDWNLLTNTIYFSPRWKSILGYAEDEIGDSPDDWFSRVHPEDLDPLRLNLAAHLKGLTGHFEHEHRMLHKDGSYHWILTRGIAVCNGKNIPHRISGSHTDVTDHKRAEEQLLFDAFHDTLTGLPNRALFLDRLKQVLEHCNRREDYAFGVLYLDLDLFKVVNDSLGHHVGDDLLMTIGGLLRSCVRSIDTVARLGGDEFVILLEDISSVEDALFVSDRIHAELISPLHIGEHSVHTSASIGIVFSRRGYAHTGDILRDADIAMYKAKILGRARSAFFEPEMHMQAIARLDLENDLRRAIQLDELHLHYQPIISLSEDKIAGVEALVRWRHPKQGIIMPGEFIPLAEETGLILAVGQWVLREACWQLRDWQTRLKGLYSFYISVNVSGQQLVNPGFIEEVREILQETRVSAKNLRFEITESTLIENKEYIAEIFKSLRQMDIQLFIDDFGTGYSSLRYIQQFPISTVKIDRGFVNQMGANSKDNEIVQSILRFAQDMGLGTVAEGVETIQQYELLKSLSCSYAQGYYFSRPVDASAAEVLITKSLGEAVA